LYIKQAILPDNIFDLNKNVPTACQISVSLFEPTTSKKQAFCSISPKNLQKNNAVVLDRRASGRRCADIFVCWI
jgi:hypothetical protein